MLVGMFFIVCMLLVSSLKNFGCSFCGFCLGWSIVILFLLNVLFFWIRVVVKIFLYVKFWIFFLMVVVVLYELLSSFLEIGFLIFCFILVLVFLMFLIIFFNLFGFNVNEWLVFGRFLLIVKCFFISFVLSWIVVYGVFVGCLLWLEKLIIVLG